MIFSWFQKSSTLFTTTSGERKEAIQKLISQGSFQGGYHLLLLISTLIVTIGLLVENTSVVIGGMVLAPLLIPILLLALGTASLHMHSFFRAASIFLASVGLVIGVSAVTTYMVVQAGIDHEIIPATLRIELYVIIAFCSGIAGAFAWIKEGVSTAMPGVAISVSLLPPLCSVGIALALENRSLFVSAGLLFSANVAGILLASILVFLFLGLQKERKQEEKAIAQNDAV